MNFPNLAKFYLYSTPRLILIALPYIVMISLLSNKNFAEALRSNLNYNWAMLAIATTSTGLLLVNQGKKINYLAHRLGL